MEKPLKLFLGPNKDYTTINLITKLDEISKMEKLEIYDIGKIMVCLEKENKGRPLNFGLTLYGTQFELELSLPIRASLGKSKQPAKSINGETLEKNINSLFTQATKYATNHNADYVLIQNLNIKIDFPSMHYKLAGLAQLLLR